MKRPSWRRFKQGLEGREPRERGVLLAALLAAIGAGWLAMVHDPLQAMQDETRARIALADARLLEQAGRLQEATAASGSDPDSFARLRLAELQAGERELDQRLDALYGRLISPTEMSQVLSGLLRSKTRLRLLALENRAPESLVTVSLEQPGGSAAAGGGDFEVFKHGLHLEFEGDFLETLHYLQSLEALDSNFFWESLEFQLIEYPRARISLDIFTLSTQRGFIGV